MNRVTHFEIYTDDPDGNVFGIIEPDTNTK